MSTKPEYPNDHVPAVEVPEGGSSCSTCEYYKGDNRCGNEYFIKWNGSDKLPKPANRYCSDWYEPLDGTLKSEKKPGIGKKLL